MRRATGVILACLVVTPVTALVTLGVARRLDHPGRPPATALQPVPQPEPPPAAPKGAAVVPDDTPWVEAVSSRTHGWLIDGRFRYHGRHPDCWVVCEVWGAREVYPADARDVVRRVLPDTGAGLDEPVSGSIDVALALPVASPHCVFGVELRAGGVGTTWYKPAAFWGAWTRSQVTQGTGDGRTRVPPGDTRLVFRHTTELPQSYFEDGHPLVRAHFDHTGRVTGPGHYHDRSIVFGRRDLLEKKLDAPVAWTAARMVGAAAGPMPVLAAAPQADFLDAYFTYARVSAYVRFLSDAEVKKVREEAGRLGDDPDARRKLARLIESFRTEPTR